MAFNPEAEVKALRARVDGLERKIDSLEKTIRALPDLAAIAKLGPRLDAAEKAIAGKKDAKTSEQEANKSNAKLVAEMQALAKDQTLVVSTHRHAMLNIVNRLIVIDQGRIIADGPRDKVLSALAEPAKAS